jgi:hypothetical protein
VDLNCARGITDEDGDHPLAEKCSTEALLQVTHFSKQLKTSNLFGRSDITAKSFDVPGFLPHSAARGQLGQLSTRSS